ncbi:MAG TPA: FliI/YscN family ATPase [Tepidisphaeraceae bacterium]|nr:FliI/YscN family ATPase [Tepidisphaeraceae bacterium]
MIYLGSQVDAVESALPYRVIGQVQAVGGLTIEASDLTLPVGSLCRITSYGGKGSIAEVIGFQHDRTLLMALDGAGGVSRGDRVENLSAAPTINCTHRLLGRVLNGLGEPIDHKAPLPMGTRRRIDARSVEAMSRVNIDQPISTSVRSIDALHTCGLGQRMGIFSGPGVGKSTLLGQIAKHTSADVSVVALVGERGREVQEFLQKILCEEGLKKCVIVVSTGDEAPLLRVRSVKVACTIAEYFRDEGMNVLLLVDSMTRLCHAQRQIGLAAREPPATRGYPPSVFSLLPQILERAGRSQRGSITGFYTVLVEGDDFNEPIPDAVKGIVDGHIWLSRPLANRGHYPAIDVLQSISRVRGDVVHSEQSRQIKRVLGLTAIYQDIEDLVNIGAYVPGTNLEFDVAVQARPRIVQFLQQDAAAPLKLEQSVRQLAELSAWIEQLEKALRAQAQKAKPAAAAAK